MSDQPAYANNPLLQEIRKDHGTLGATVEGASEAPGTLQNELRPTESEDREPGGNPQNGSGRPGRSNGTSKRVERTAERSDQRKGRTGPAPHENNSGANGSHRPDNGALPATAIGQKITALYKANPGIGYSAAAREAGCSVTTATNYLKALKGNVSEKQQSNAGQEDKPAGLDAKPHEKEQAARKEQQEQQQADIKEKSGQASVKGLFSLFNRAKDNGKKEDIRNKPLSEREAEEIKEPLLAALMDYFKYADEFIYATHKAHRQVQIWASIDEEEAEILVDVWLAQAKRSAKAASHVVRVVNSHAQLQVGIILVPRFYQTFRVYMDSGIGVR